MDKAMRHLRSSATLADLAPITSRSVANDLPTSAISRDILQQGDKQKRSQ
jgi:hypothetical protein